VVDQDEVIAVRPRTCSRQAAVVAAAHRATAAATCARSIQRDSHRASVPTWSGCASISLERSRRSPQTLHSGVVSPFFGRVLSFARVLLVPRSAVLLRRGARGRGARRRSRVHATATALLLALVAGAPIARRASVARVAGN
jgi:hypothetical protein